MTTGSFTPASVALGRRTWMRMRSLMPSRSESRFGISTQTLWLTIGCPANTGWARPSTNCCAEAGADNSSAVSAAAVGQVMRFIVRSSFLVLLPQRLRPADDRQSEVAGGRVHGDLGARRRAQREDQRRIAFPIAGKQHQADA